ncbi:hypothetical protein E8M01_15705 [Phreatobacter stygius]|uniref:Uncharacterized protein n=1 Tax=Phreatobacter stygius TaxID=1940610 RepID=A0A4D7B397_9HYPH|nr:hypothetical protein E8M01_15705 [Phreatobacter stygius]
MAMTLAELTWWRKAAEIRRVRRQVDLALAIRGG